MHVLLLEHILTTAGSTEYASTNLAFPSWCWAAIYTKIASESSNQRVFYSQCAKPWQSARYKTCDDCRRKVTERVQYRRLSFLLLCVQQVWLTLIAGNVVKVPQRRMSGTDDEESPKKHLLGQKCNRDHEGDPESTPKKHLPVQKCSRDHEGHPESTPKKHLLVQMCSRNRVGNLER